MQFTVTLELNDQELKALSKGNFEEIRKDFFQNADFCNFVINTYEINNEFLDLALAQHKISTFSFGKIFEKFNLLDYPLKLSESEFKQCLLHWSLHDEYQTIAKSTGKITLRLYCISWEHLRQFSPQRIRIFLVIALRTMK